MFLWEPNQIPAATPIVQISNNAFVIEKNAQTTVRNNQKRKVKKWLIKIDSCCGGALHIMFETEGNTTEDGLCLLIWWGN